MGLLLQAYGLATWDCFRKPLSQGGLRLQDIVKLAEGVGGPNHGFRLASRIIFPSKSAPVPATLCECRVFNSSKVLRQVRQSHIDALCCTMQAAPAVLAALAACHACTMQYQGWPRAAIHALRHGRRYVQLPINAGMREAWEEPWQMVELDGGRDQLCLMAAAARLGVGVFASGPLLEGTLLKDDALMVRPCSHCTAMHLRLMFVPAGGLALKRRCSPAQHGGIICALHPGLGLCVLVRCDGNGAWAEHRDRGPDQSLVVLTGEDSAC